MEKKGLVAKRKDRKKGNIVRISITKKGQQLCSQAMGQDLIHDIIANLTDEQREQLWSSLIVIYREALNQLGIEMDEKSLLLL